MTWITINKENQSNLSKIAYSKQKTQITEEFEKIKKEVGININISILKHILHDLSIC